MDERGDMRRETRDEGRHETSRLLGAFVSRLTSTLSRLMSHVSCPWAIASLLLVGLVWALFGQTGSFEFLRFDDPDYTFNCAFVKDGLSWANVREAFTNVRHAAIWMPVTNISYMCTISLFGPGAGAHHLVNVGIHALNAVLLLWLLVALGQRASCPLRSHSCSPPFGRFTRSAWRRWRGSPAGRNFSAPLSSSGASSAGSARGGGRDGGGFLRWQARMPATHWRA